MWGGMVWYAWYGVVLYGLVWFGVVWKIAVCQNLSPTRAPEIPYGAIGPELRRTCDGIGVGWCGMVYYGVVGY